MGTGYYILNYEDYIELDTFEVEEDNNLIIGYQIKSEPESDKNGRVFVYSCYPKEQEEISEEIEIPSNVTYDGKTYDVVGIGIRAFEEKYFISSVEIPNTVERIAEGAFLASSLASVNIPNTVTSIGRQAFVSCQSLTEITIPANVTRLDGAISSYSENLKAINVDSENPNYKSIDGVLYSKDGKTLIEYPYGKKTYSFAIPEGVETINQDAFSYAPSFKNVIIPASVTTIEEGTFGDSEYTKNLENVFLQNGSTVDTNNIQTKDNGKIWSYDVEIPASESSDGKTHVSITSVTDKNGVAISEEISFLPNVLSSSYVIDSFDESITVLMLGDINKSGEVDVIDLQMLYNHVTENSVITDEEQLKRANMNNDSNIDVLDLQALFNIIATS